jgi:hypothetical protein
MSITQYRALFPGPAVGTAAVLAQECACSPFTKQGRGSLHLSTLSISKSVIKVIDHKRAYESQKRDHEPHKRREIRVHKRKSWQARLLLIS